MRLPVIAWIGVWLGTLSTELWELTERKAVKLSWYVTHALHTARIRYNNIVVNDDKWIKMVNFKLGDLYSFISIHDDSDIANPSSLQDACHIWVQFYGLALHDALLIAQQIECRCWGGHGFDFCQGLRVISLSHTQVINWSHFDYFILITSHY